MMIFSCFAPLRSLRSPGLAALLALLASTITASAQTPPTGDGVAGSNPEERRNRREFNPEEMRNRLEAALREQFQPENDEEWAIIKERVQKVAELRRTAMAGAMGGLMGGMGRGMMLPGGPGGGQAARGRGGFGASPETEALQAAIKANAPAAEIKARLERLRESRKANEAKLAQAQEDLRAVLNVRQEAVAVMAGLLP